MTVTPTLTVTRMVTGTSDPIPTVSGEPFSNAGSSSLRSLAIQFGPMIGAISVLLVCLFYVLHKRRKNQSVTKQYATVLEQYVKQEGSQKRHTPSATGGEEGKLEQNKLAQMPPMANTETIGKRRLSKLEVNGSKVNPLRSAAVTKVHDFTIPNIEIIESGTMKNNPSYSDVTVVSVKTPNLSEASTGSESKVHLARIDDIDTSGMKIADRAVLKLRKWKAVLLAEVPPMVEVKRTDNQRAMECTDGTSRRRKSLIQRLSFAKRVGGDRSIIDEEAETYTLSRRDLVSQRQRKKKEFQAVPRYTSRSSLYTSRSRAFV